MALVLAIALAPLPQAGQAGDTEKAKAGQAERQGGGLTLKRFDSFDQPTYVHGPPGAQNTLFVVERAGRIVVYKNGERRGVFLDIRGIVRCCDGERGLYSVAFADYRNSLRFYVYYTDNGGDLRISEFRMRPNNPLRADKSTRRDLLRIEHSRQTNHNGGQLQWGPDNKLWIATGDGGGGGDPGENAQDKRSLLGKLLRIDPLRNPRGRKRYAIPRDNPFRGRPGRDEIWAVGLRNPYRFSFDKNRLAIGDVGQDRYEEINFRTIKGSRRGNFGWDNYEGNSIFEGPRLKRHIRPIKTYSHSNGRCSVTGGYVVRDRDLGGLTGRYIYGDLCTGEVRSFRATTKGARGDRGTSLDTGGGLVSFGTDARSNVYVIAGGTVFRVARR